jgi:molybdopterin-guanine dinucleotide biosynthesis protein A
MTGMRSETIPVCVVIERHPVDHVWAAEAWRAAGVLAGNSTASSWGVVLRREGALEQVLLASDGLTLHRSDVASYRYNLQGQSPSLFVVLRKTAGGEGVPWRVLLVSAAPDEAQKLMDAGEDLVEAVAMPESVRAWVEDFCSRLPPEEPFQKRRRKNWNEG